MLSGTKWGIGLEQQMGDVAAEDQASDKPIQDGEVVVGVLPNNLRCLAVVRNRTHAECVQTTTTHGSDGDATITTALKSKYDLLTALLWAVIISEFDLDPKKNYGLRQGNQLVEVPSRQPVLKIMMITGGGGMALSLTELVERLDHREGGH